MRPEENTSMALATPALRRTIVMVIAATAIALSTAACSSSTDAGASGSSHGGATGTQAALCADAVGDAVKTDPNASDVEILLTTWNQMAKDAPPDIHATIVAGDQAVQKMSKGDESQATEAAFTKSFGDLTTWIADNCTQ
jgi:hypothetical protein